MKQLIILSSLSLLLAACGGNNAKDAADKAVNKTKEVVKEGAEKAAQAAGASTETVAKAGDAANKVVEGAAGAINKKAAVEDAKKAAMAFGKALQAELKAAMKDGGPVNALDVCNTKAGPIAEKVAKEQNATITRVSLKNRNKDHVPNDWQKAILEDFNARAAKGEDVKKMGFAEVVDNDGKKQLRFMKALPVGDVCLKCHGSNIEPKVQAKITELYPDDKATGYEKGQIRGAVVILKDL